jgi:chemosensory pili system protein ChpC
MNKALVNCVLLPVSHGHVLIPNTAVASMISFTKPAPLPDSPKWLLGMINWQGWYLPVVSWTGIVDPGSNETLDGARIAVIKNLHKSGGMPYFAIIAKGFPRLLSITSQDLGNIDKHVMKDDGTGSSDCLLATVELDNRPVELPALPALGAYISRHLQRKD